MDDKLEVFSEKEEYLGYFNEGQRVAQRGWIDVVMIYTLPTVRVEPATLPPLANSAMYQALRLPTRKHYQNKLRWVAVAESREALENARGFIPELVAWAFYKDFKDSPDGLYEMGIDPAHPFSQAYDIARDIITIQGVPHVGYRQANPQNHGRPPQGANHFPGTSAAFINSLQSRRAGKSVLSQARQSFRSASQGWQQAMLSQMAFNKLGHPPDPVPEIKDEGIVMGELSGFRYWMVKNGKLCSPYRHSVWSTDIFSADIPPDPYNCFGIYVFKDWGSMNNDHCNFLMEWCMLRSEFNMMRQDAISIVLGEVVCWGQVIEHDRGYRAEHARITKLTSSTGISIDLDSLRSLYCP